MPRPDVRLFAILLSIAIIALAVRLTYIVKRPVAEAPDSIQYRAIAENIRAHRSFSLDSRPPFGPTIRRPPLFPLFVALVGGSAKTISGDRVRIWQAALDSLVAAMISLILYGLVRLRWAVAAGMLYAFHPAAMLYASSILSESLFTFAVTAAVLVFLFGIHRDKLTWVAAAGLLMGLAALARPLAVPFFAVVAVSIWLSRRSIRRPVAVTIAFSMASVLVMTPWIVRCSAVAGHFVLIMATGPINFALATAPESWNLADQSSIWQSEHFWREDPCGRAMLEAHTPPEAARADEICLQTALANLKANPRAYLRNRVVQLARFPLSSFDIATGNSTSFQTALHQREWNELGMKLALFLLFSVLPLLAGAIGLVVGRPSIEKNLCGALWIGTIVIQMLGYVEYRYFFPAVPMLLITAALALDRFGSRDEPVHFAIEPT